MELQLGELGYTLNEVEILKSRVKTHLYLMYETYKGTEKSHVDVHEDGDDGVDLGDGGGGGDDYDMELRIERRLNRQRNEARLKEIANEVDKYFNDAYESTRNDDFDLLGWWKSKISSYSILSNVAKDVLAFPSSTVACENAFSLGGRIVDPFRASLTSRMLEALVCTNDWLRGKEFQFHKQPTEEELEFYMKLEQLEQSIPNTNEMPPPPSKSSNPPES
ncbi:Zinc finger BED domain-containing protein DAYSLEEPER [Striga hermonthica]|uniref:Zinc finger BED domain-containing protein DAYSLEEPER n=1 Tax=Striga hermonthica TaxID=68872 RepID=A0A9N7RH64_STRHE|nr:Zinc finger BED domain-containing protein DAYSLEEPER [Striga hermonthica]